MTVRIISILLLIIHLSCSQQDNIVTKTETIKNLVFNFKLEDGRFTDTLKIYDINKNLLMFQIWEKGQSKAISVLDKNGKTRRLEFYNRTDSSSSTQYYFDIEDENFKCFPIGEETFEFYEKYSFLSHQIIDKDSTTKIQLYNYPTVHATMAVTNGRINFEDGNFFIKPNSKKADTVSVYLMNPFNGRFSKEFKIITN